MFGLFAGLWQGEPEVAAMQSKNGGKRKRRSGEKEAWWRQQVGEQATSNLSVRSFCEQNGLSEASFYAWRRELAVRDQTQTSASSTQPVERDEKDRHNGTQILAQHPEVWRLRLRVGRPHAAREGFITAERDVYYFAGTFPRAASSYSLTGRTRLS